MDTLSAIGLGLVQGLTEFLPVSSTGHLIVARDVFGIVDSHPLTFAAVLHIATLGAVIVYFWEELVVLGRTLFRWLGRLPVNATDLTLIKALALGTIPAVILGLLLEDLIATAFQSPLLVAAVLVIGSVLFMVAEYYYENCYHHRTLDTRLGFKIGLAQALALFPGMSRSGIAIAAGMYWGLSRIDATRFSFLLAIPIIAGAGSLKVYELLTTGSDAPLTPVLIGAGVAFATGLLAIHVMVSFVRRYSLWPFIWYRIILAGFIVFFTVF